MDRAKLLEICVKGLHGFWNGYQGTGPVQVLVTALSWVYPICSTHMLKHHTLPSGGLLLRLLHA
jgi:hypothetical protein